MSDWRSSRPKKGLIFRRYRWCPRAGRMLDAHDYGHKAWPIQPRQK